MKVTIFTNMIPRYREPFFESLGNCYELKVVHSGESRKAGSSSYQECVIPAMAVGPFHVQAPWTILRHSCGADVVVIMFDLSWVSTYWPLFVPNRKRILLWGHWYSDRQSANMIRNILMRKADGVLLYSDQEVSQIVKNGIPKQKITVAHNTVVVANSRNTSSFEKDRFLFIGRLNNSARQSSKRVDLLLRSFAAILNEIPDNINVDIIGDGPDRACLERLCRELSIDNRVNFYGHIGEDDALLPFFERSFAVVSPGHVGLSVLQAFSYGVPVITGRAKRRGAAAQHLTNLLTQSNVVMGPEYYNIEHGTTGILVGSMEELIDNMLRCIRHPEVPRSLGNEAYAHYVKERSLSSMVDAFKRAVG